MLTFEQTRSLSFTFQDAILFRTLWWWANINTIKKGFRLTWDCYRTLWLYLVVLLHLKHLQKLPGRLGVPALYRLHLCNLNLLLHHLPTSNLLRNPKLPSTSIRRLRLTAAPSLPRLQVCQSSAKAVFRHNITIKKAENDSVDDDQL